MKSTDNVTTTMNSLNIQPFTPQSVSQFLSTDHPSTTPIYPALLPMELTKLFCLHIQACRTHRPQLNADTDPAEYMNSYYCTEMLQALIGSKWPRKTKRCDPADHIVKYFQCSSDELKAFFESDKELIYIWTSLKTGRQYIGSTSDLLKRTRQHFDEAIKLKSQIREFNHAIRTHKRQEWNLQVLRFIEKDELEKMVKREKIQHNTVRHRLEAFYIKSLETQWPNGYNMDAGQEIKDNKFTGTQSTVQDIFKERQKLLKIYSSNRNCSEKEETADTVEKLLNCVTKLCQHLTINDAS